VIAQITRLSHRLTSVLLPFQQAPALRTLLSRTATTTSSAAPPRNHLSAASLSNLFDRLKALPANDSPEPTQAELSLYRDYAVDPETMKTLRRWVNSPSIDPEKTKVKLSEQGEESVEMTVSISRRCECRKPFQADEHPSYRNRLSGSMRHRQKRKSRFHQHNQEIATVS